MPQIMGYNGGRPIPTGQGRDVASGRGSAPAAEIRRRSRMSVRVASQTEEQQSGSLYESTMRLFRDTATLLDLDPRVTMELQEPHHELIFHITVDINNRLVAFTE